MNASALPQAVRAAALGLVLAATVGAASAAAVPAPTHGAVVARVAPEPAASDSSTSCGGGRMSVACGARTAVVPGAVVPHEAAAALSAEVSAGTLAGASVPTAVVPHEAAAALSAEMSAGIPASAPADSLRGQARARQHASSVHVPHAAAAALSAELGG